VIFEPKRALAWAAIAFPALVAFQAVAYWLANKPYDLSNMVVKTALVCLTIGLIHTFTKFFTK
jgi:hypothetical protein